MKIRKELFVKNVINFAVIFLLALIACFKGNTKDTEAYYWVFKNIEFYNLTFKDFYYQTGMEIGYGIISYIINFFSSNFIVFSYIFSFLTFYFIKKSTNLLSVTFCNVMLFYLPTFFVTQQLMQIRQGFASAIIFYSLILFYNSKKKQMSFFYLLFACSVHSTAIAFVGFFFPIFRKFLDKNIKIYLKLLFWFCIIFVLCRLVMNFSLLTAVSERISSYTEIEAFSGTRDFLSLPNIRSVIYSLFFIYCYKKVSDPNYKLLLFLYLASTATRLGFYDFEILSGRLGVAFGFSEIFLLPMALKALTKNYIYFYICGVSYFVIHGYITLNFQVPYIITDYFEPFIYN